MDGIEWTQVIIAFIAGVVLSAMVKGLAGQLKSKVAG